MRLVNADDLDFFFCDTVEECSFALGNAPTVDAVPVVHGRWEFDGSDWSDIWKCSACGDEWFFEYDPRDAETLVKFCPNCGARMDGGDGNGI